jgi:RING finger protein 170
MHYLIVVLAIIATIFVLKYFLKSQSVDARYPERVFHAEECPICLEDPSYPVQASCGHEFCCNIYTAKCILDSLERSSQCPICRRTISMLFKNFEDCPSELKNRLKRYNAFHDDRTLWQMIYETPVLIQRFFAHNDYRDARTTITVLGLICVSVVYIFLPVDIIDEETYGLPGLIDDFGVVFGAIFYISIIIFKAVLSEASRP